MAWQSLSGMGGGGNGGGNGGQDGNGQQQGNQPQGTEYTLQGRLSRKSIQIVGESIMLTTTRCNAIPPNRMAQTRARSKCLGDRKAGDEGENS